MAFFNSAGFTEPVIRVFSSLRRASIPAAVVLLLGSDAAFALAGAEIEGDVHQAARIKAYEAQIACGEIRATVPLAALPHGRVAAFVDQGVALVQHGTGHAYSRSMMVALAMPPPSHIVCRP